MSLSSHPHCTSFWRFRRLQRDPAREAMTALLTGDSEIRRTEIGHTETSGDNQRVSRFLVDIGTTEGNRQVP